MKRNFLFLLLVFLYGCGEIDHQSDVSLLPVISRTIDSTWQFQSQSEQVLRPARVPGCVHLDLLENQVISDPYAENNEQEVQWIENENWEYSTTLSVKPDELGYQHVELEFSGLDTRAKVYLNDTLILEADNMFRTWHVGVKQWLKQGDNHLKVIFNSPVQSYKDAVENHPYQLPAGCETGDLQVSPFIRKAPYHFGWDWGPRLVTSGIWRPIRLRAWNTHRIANVRIETEKADSAGGSVWVDVDVESNREDEPVAVHINDQYTVLTASKGISTVTSRLLVDADELWWPNGFGKQQLHAIDIELIKSGEILDTRHYDYGVRTIELINEPDEIGTSFYFKVNQKPIFIKGANYIPQDLLLSRVKESDYEELILMAKEANMNMLRVWGGGIYENDLFYDLCDRHGIMVWQDFMFAGSMYPFRADFSANVMEEVKDNVKRLRNHPCIALWCGNNEMEVAFHNWGWQEQFGWTDEQRDEIWKGYTELFHQMIPDTLAKYSPGISYTSTSPLSNWGTSANFNHGSMHYWGVWHGREPFENYTSNVPRFMVEYGFQSFPAYRTLAEVISSDWLNLDSEVMQNRQKSYIGNGLIVKHSEELFGPADSFKDLIVNSQKAQGEAYRMAIRAHRLNKGHCMGTMFWQLNDCWQGPSWSVIDYYRQPKPAYNAVKALYQPMVAFGALTADSLQVTLISDLLNEQKIDLKLTAQTTNHEFEIWNQTYTLSANGIETVVSAPLSSFDLGSGELISIRIEAMAGSNEYREVVYVE